MLNGALGLGFVLSAKDATGAAFKSVRDKFGQLQTQARKFRSEAKDTFSGLFAARGWERLQAGFRQAGAAAERFRQQVRNVRTELNSMHQRGMDSRAKVEGLMGDVRGGGLRVMAAGGAGLAAAGYMAKQSGDMSMAMAQFKVVSKASAGEMDLVKQKALELGYSTKYAGSQAVDAMTSISSSGFNAAQTLKMVGPALDFATASMGKLTTAEAGKTISNALNAFGLDAEMATTTTDKLSRAMDMFALDADHFELGLSGAAKGARLTNQSLDDTLILLGTLKNAGDRTETAATAVAMGMTRIANVDTQKMLKEMGVVGQTSSGGFRDFLGVLGDLEPKLAKMSEIDAANWVGEAFGTEATGSIIKFMGALRKGIEVDGVMLKGRDAIAHMRREIQNSQGAASSMAAAMNETLPGGIDRLKATWKTAMEEIGEPFEQAFKPAVEQLRAGIKWVVDEIRSMSPEARAFAANAFLVASGVMAVVGGLTAAGAAFSIWKAGMAAAQATGLMTAGTMLPMLLVFGLIAIAATGFKRAIDDNVGGSADKLREFADAGEWLKAKVLGVWDAITQFADGAAEGFSTFVPAILTAFSELGSAFKDFGSDAFGGSEDANRFATTGQKVGAVIGKLVIGVIKLTTLGVRVADFFFTAGQAAYSLLDRLGLLDFAVENAHGILAAFVGLKVAAWAYGAAAAMTPLTLKILVVAAAFAAVASAIDQALKLYKEWDENSGTQIKNEFLHDTGIIDTAEYQRRMNERQGIQAGYGSGDAVALERQITGEGQAAKGVGWFAQVSAAKLGSMPSPVAPPGGGRMELDATKLDASAARFEKAASALPRELKVTVEVEQGTTPTGAYTLE